MKKKGNEAVKERILSLIAQKGLSINAVCTKGFLTTSTLNTFLNGRSEYCSVKTIIKVCQGLDITLYDFFNDDSFKNLQEEID